jgi:integrase
VPQAKSKAGNREHVLGPDAGRILREQSVAQQVDGRPNPHGLVFPSPMGKHWRDSNFNRRVWQRARLAGGRPDLIFHALRYFYKSHIENAGFPPALTKQLVGHSDDRTHRGYIRPIPGTEAAIREAQAGLFERPDKR